MFGINQRELATKQRCGVVAKLVFGFWMATAVWLVVITCQAAMGSEAAALKGLEVRVPVEGRFLGLTGPDPVSLILQVRNASDREQKAVVSANLLLPTGREVGVHADVTVGVGQIQKVELPLPERPPYGLLVTHFRLESDGDVSEWGSDVVALYPRNQPARRGESVFPVGFATGAPRCTPHLLEVAASVGFEFHRFEPNWGSIQPREGQWQWQGVDDYVAQLERVGLRPQPLMHGSARWAAKSHTSPPRLDAWRKFCAAMAERYRGRIEFWEIWNEPDIGFFEGTVEEYIAMQRAAYEAIKSVAPNEVVTSGGFASLDHGRVKPEIYESTLREYPRAYDWFAYHQHGAFPEFYNAVAIQLPGLQRQAGVTKVPLVFTETGMDTRFGQRFQALTLMKKMAFAAAIGAKGYGLYNLMDRAGDTESTKPGLTYGLLSNPTGTGRFSEVDDAVRPKESFVAVATAIRELRHRPPLATWMQDGKTFAFLYGLPGDYLVAGWHEDVRTPDPVLAVTCGDDPQLRLTRIDIFGNETEWTHHQGITFLPLSEPVYYRIRGVSKPPVLIGPAVKWPELVTPATGGEVAMNVDLYNPTVADIRGRVCIASPSAVAQPPINRSVGSHQWKAFPLRFTVGERRFGEVVPVEVSAQWGGYPELRLRVPVVFNTMDATKDQRLTLREMTHVTNKNEHDPHTLHLLWRGATDLSVQAVLVVDATERTLRLQMEVTDDTHHPLIGEGKLTEGDAVEFAWQTATGDRARVEIAGVPGQTPQVAGSLDKAVRRAVITRTNQRTTCEITLSLDAMGLGPQDFEKGISFNFAVHDNDGKGPKSWISPAPGLGGTDDFNPNDFFRLLLP